MKILRQKLFTFQDKKAFLEFYKATGGLKHLPKGKKGMNARDVYRIKDIAQKIDSGDLEGVNYDEARQILERMGLPESGKGIKHLIQKYKNIYDPEFQKRFQRIHNRELDQINNKYQDKLNRVGDLSWKYGWGDMTNRNFYRLREIQKKLKDQKSIETSPFIRRDPSKSATKILNISIRENEKAIQRTNNVAPLGVNDLNPGTETRNLSQALVDVGDPKKRQILELYLSETFKSIKPILLLNLMQKLMLVMDYCLKPENLLNPNQFTSSDIILIVGKLMEYSQQLGDMMDQLTIKDSDKLLKKMAEENDNTDMESEDSKNMVRNFMDLFKKDSGIKE